MYVVKEIAPNGKTAELHLDTSIINAIHIMTMAQAEQMNRLADLGVNIRATEDANHLAVGVLKPDGLTQYEVFYRSGDASTDKPVPNIDQVIKKLME